ncbi:MAG: hypothetical protein EBU90_18580 [Proteobacteria bacterium]|nr:hypothetical protein [Pseudomonadota bacterium]NBP14640.1 hypothetical protein [bacterium]
MNIDKYGRVQVSSDEAFRALYAGRITTFANLFFEEDVIQQFNDARKKNVDNFSALESLPEEESLELFDQSNQCTWFMPEEYQNFPIVHWLHKQCTTDEQLQRVDKELELFIQHNMFDLLFYLKYLVDTMRKHKIVWGVGRGSSVSSYVLYLIGVHKINSIFYNLDIGEFLKEK